MKKAPKKKFDLDVNICFGECILRNRYLDFIQEFLKKRAFLWSGQLIVYYNTQKRFYVDIKKEHSLFEGIQSIVNTLKGNTESRVFGNIELRGSDNSLVTVISVDEQIFKYYRHGDFWTWGNRVSFQVRSPEISGFNSIEWSVEALEMICEGLSPFYAHAQTPEEYDTKNIHRERGSVKAVGIDISQYLPGIYWLNFFGKPYRDLIGKPRLLSAPSYQVKELDDGVLLKLHRDPSMSKTDEYKRTENACIDYIGKKYFFLKDDINTIKAAPDFHLR